MRRTIFWLEACVPLKWLALTKVGSIPDAIASCTTKSHAISCSINLDSNQLSGTIPHAYSYRPRVSIRIGRNKLSGTIPSALASVKLYDMLYLQENELSGAVPDLKIFSSALLNGNKLTGALPLLHNTGGRSSDLSFKGCFIRPY